MGFFEGDFFEDTCCADVGVHDEGGGISFEAEHAVVAEHVVADAV